MNAETRNVIYQRKLYMAIELASTSWRLALSDGLGRSPRTVAVHPFVGPQLVGELAEAKRRFELDAECEVVICMEAGRDGFSVHRWLESLGLGSLVIDAASVEVSRHKRRAKTDRLDAERLVNTLIRYDSGDKKCWRVCRVPSEVAEDERRVTRERERLVKERTQHRNRLKSLLATVGVRTKLDRHFLAELETLVDPRGRALPPRLRAELQREYARLELVQAQIQELDTELKTIATTPPKMSTSPMNRLIATLALVRGIGPVGASTLVTEMFGWRDFKNRKEVGSAAGLTPTPYNTGCSVREQGIDKAGNRRVRRIAVELAWSWLRYQPDSKLSKQYREKHANGGSKRKGIVALARKLLIALWRMLKTGVIPEGAVLKAGHREVTA